MSAAPGWGRALVMFGDEVELWWLRLLKPGFRHCFVALAGQSGWLVVDPLSHCTALAHFPVPADFDLADHYRQHGYVVVETAVLSAERRVAPWRPYSCVEEVKRILGIHAGCVLTPWQLFRHLEQKEKTKLTAGRY